MYKGFNILFLFCFVTINFQCTDNKQKPDEYLEVALIQSISKINADTFLIDSIVDFEWDELYIIKPYLPNSNYLELRNKLKNLPLEIMPFLSDGINYLIFVNDNKVIKYIKVPRAPCCDFATINPSENPTSITSGATLYKEKVTNEIQIKIAKP